MQWTVLSDNRSCYPVFETEHGLSILLTTDQHKILLDTGASDVFIRNAKQLGIDLSDVDYVFISHGPSNHIGQGACVIKGQMFIPVGLGTEQHPSILYVWNLKKKHLDHILNFQQQVPHEFEDCEPYHHDLIMQTNGGGLLRLKNDINIKQ